MPSAQHDQFATLMGAGKLTPGTPIDQMRSGYDALALLFPAAEGVERADEPVGGVSALRFVPPSAARTVLYLHGGGYVIGSSQSHTPLASHLAAAARAEVVLLDYRLAPEHPYPAAVEDALAAYRALTAGGVAPGSLVLAGDSAGGGLALATLLRLRDAGDTLPAGAVLLSPLVDAGWRESSVPETDDPILSKALGAFWLAQYAGDTPLDDPGLSPIRADLAGLPPVLVEVGTREILLDQGIAFADAARAAGVEVDIDVEAGLIHHWPVFTDAFPEAKATIARVADWIIEHTG